MRVIAILDAGADVIAAKGFAAATMTEIAARSKTAIGSLYRFFPTKDALADALSQRYLGDIVAKLAAIEERAPHLPSEGIADALFDLMLDLRRDRAAAVALVEVLGDSDDRRTALRESVRRGTAAILRAAGPHLAARRIAIVTPVVLQLLKAVTRLAEDPTDLKPRLAELRIALRLYVAHSLA